MSHELIESFISEKRYLQNVAKGTLMLYELAFREFGPHLPNDLMQLRKSHFVPPVAALQERGVRPATVNCYLRCMNTFLLWAHKEGHTSERIRIPNLKIEDRVPEIYSEDCTRRLVAYTPKTGNLRRAHILAVLILDTGLRLAEALSLKVADADLDNRVIRVLGKGRKERLIPFSDALRRRLFAFLRDKKPHEYIFSTRTGTALTNRNAERDFAKLCDVAGVKKVPRAIHAIRHTFACSFLKAGGSIYVLSRILGHSKITTTTIYLRATGVDTIKQQHDQFSPLSSIR